MQLLKDIDTSSAFSSGSASKREARPIYHGGVNFRKTSSANYIGEKIIPGLGWLSSATGQFTCPVGQLVLLRRSAWKKFASGNSSHKATGILLGGEGISPKEELAAPGPSSLLKVPPPENEFCWPKMSFVGGNKFP